MIRRTPTPERRGNMRFYDRFFVDLFRVLGIILAVVLITIFVAWIYTTRQLAIASSRGVYPSAEEGMRSIINKNYEGISRFQILGAGPNDGSAKDKSHIWYVVAVVHATSYADGSGVGHKGCDAPGLFFLQTKTGWVQVSEGAFPGMIGYWMKVFGLAGSGQSEPSTDNTPPGKLCP
jgi:hypothetical protein